MACMYSSMNMCFYLGRKKVPDSSIPVVFYENTALNTIIDYVLRIRTPEEQKFIRALYMSLKNFPLETLGVCRFYRTLYDYTDLDTIQECCLMGVYILSKVAKRKRLTQAEVLKQIEDGVLNTKDWGVEKVSSYSGIHDTGFIWSLMNMNDDLYEYDSDERYEIVLSALQEMMKLDSKRNSESQGDTTNG